MTETVIAAGDTVPGLKSKIAEAHTIIDNAVTEHLGTHTLVAACVLFSGGNDSTTLFHLVKDRITHAVHANTTIGVESTRQFVRDQCAAHAVPLLEKVAPTTYADLCLVQGFPGPAMHFKMYQRLKERGLRLARKELVSNPRKERVLFIAGRRRQESARRSDIPLSERQGSVIWASPIAYWSKDDLNAYREAFNVPRNPVADALGMSGECLCGAFAEPGEFEHIARVVPEVAAEIVALEHAVRKSGAPEQKCQWGWGAYREDPEAQPAKSGPLCSSCDARWDRAHPVVTGALSLRASRKDQHEGTILDTTDTTEQEPKR